MQDETAVALSRALHHSLEFLGKLDEAPVGATASLQTLRQRLLKSLGDGPRPAAQVIDELVADSKAASLAAPAAVSMLGWWVARFRLPSPRTG
jgi:hypothetical protein